MRKALTVCAVLCAVILCALSGNAEGWGCADCGNPLETDSAFCPFCGAERPGDHPDRTGAPEGTVSRAAAEIKPATAEEIKERLACRLASNGDVSWKPKDRQPLNVYMVVRNGSDQLLDGEIAKVSETDGLSPEYVRELTECARVIEERSGGAIRFVEDPNQAAVQLAVRLDYEFAGKYANDSGNVLNGYSTHLYMKATLLGDDRFNSIISLSGIPGEVAVYYGSPDAKVYCMPVPDLRGTPELDELVDAVMCWFGFNPEGDSYQGMFAKALEEIRQKLYERGYLAETGDAVYDDAMREAVRQLQADYDLATTGGLDAATLAAVWYDRQSLEPMRKAYMEERLRQNTEMRRYCETCGYVWNRGNWTYCPRCGAELKDSLPAAKASGVSAGDTVVFGRWKQGNVKKNAVEDIEWIVLEVEDGKALLLSRYALDSQQYSKQDRDTPWEKSALRSWLNGNFLKNAFSKEEKKAILVSVLANDADQGWPKYRTDGGKETEDSVFLLSYAEVMKYLPHRQDRICATTPVNETRKITLWDAWRVNGRSACNWFLRSPVEDLGRISYVTCSGTISGNNAAVKEITVRPAIRVDAEVLAQMQPAE